MSANSEYLVEVPPLGDPNKPCCVKLNKGGNSLPLGIRTPGCRSSLKKACAQASMGEMREEGVYSNSRLTSSMASGGVRERNTYTTKHNGHLMIPQCTAQRLITARLSAERAESHQCTAQRLITARLSAESNRSSIPSLSWASFS